MMDLSGIGRPPAARESSRVLIRHAAPSDYEFMYRLEGNEVPLRPWVYCGTMPERENYLELLFRSTEAVMLAVDKEGGAPFGVMMAYDADWSNRTMWVAATAVEAMHSLGKPVRALGLFLDYCFSNWDLRYVYVELNASQFPKVKSLPRLLAEECGRYIAHDLIATGYEDRLIFSIARERWSALPSRLTTGARETYALSPHSGELSLQAFCDLVASALDLPDASVQPSSLLIEHLGFDSLEFYCFQCLLEDLSGWEVPGGLFENIQTIEDGYFYVRTRLEASGRGPE